jgi:solute:Na+ symporter, SSS family
MNWLIFWIVLYLALIIWLALRHLRTSDFEQYLVNNRNTRTLPLVFTVLATFVGGGTSIGLMALGYESGFAAVAIGVAYVIGFVIMSFYAGKIRTYGAKYNIYSFPHFLNHKFTSANEQNFSRVFSAAVSGVNIFIFFFILSAQFVAMASLLKFTFEIGYTSAVVISALIIIVYTAIAGLSGVILTDMIQFIAIVIMILLIFIPGILQDTEYFVRLEELPREMINGTQLGWGFLIGTILFLSWSVLVRMDIWQRILAAKSEKIARRVSIWSGIGMLPFYIIFPLVGMTIKLVLERDLKTHESADVAYEFISRHTSEYLFGGFDIGPLLLGFAVVGLLSALMSSGDSFLNIISISAVKDFVGWGKKKGDISQEKAHLMIRIATIVFGVVALFVALVFPYIVDLMVVGISTITIFAPITLFALVSKNAFAYRKAALASILVAFFINFALFTYGTLYPELFQAKTSFVPAFIVGSLVLFIGVKMTKRESFEKTNS